MLSRVQQEAIASMRRCLMSKKIQPVVEPVPIVPAGLPPEPLKFSPPKLRESLPPDDLEMLAQIDNALHAIPPPPLSSHVRCNNCRHADRSGSGDTIMGWLPCLSNGEGGWGNALRLCAKFHQAQVNQPGTEGQE